MSSTDIEEFEILQISNRLLEIWDEEPLAEMGGAGNIKLFRIEISSLLDMVGLEVISLLEDTTKGSNCVDCDGGEITWEFGVDTGVVLVECNEEYMRASGDVWEETEDGEGELREVEVDVGECNENICEQVEMFEKRREMVKENCEKLKSIWENAMGNTCEQVEMFEVWEMVREKYFEKLGQVLEQFGEYVVENSHYKPLSVQFSAIWPQSTPYPLRIYHK